MVNTETEMTFLEINGYDMFKNVLYYNIIFIDGRFWEYKLHIAVAGILQMVWNVSGRI